MESSSKPARDSASSPELATRPKYPAPELLARLVVRCRELETFLRMSLGNLPSPEQSPFLFGQLEDVVTRLQEGLAELELEGPERGEDDWGGLRRLFSGKKRKAAAPTYPQARSLGKARYDLQGSAWTVPVTELVGFLSQTGKSGVLWVTTTSETFVLEFTRGSLVHAASNAPPRNFRLGEILIQMDVLERERLEREIAGAKATKQFLGSHMLRSGAVTSDQLQQALTLQVQELFHRLMDAENATYGFQDGLQLMRAQTLKVNITSLLLESARKKDEARLRAEGKTPPPPLAFLEPDEAFAEASPPSAQAPVEGEAPLEECAPEEEERASTEPAPEAQAEASTEQPSEPQEPAAALPIARHPEEAELDAELEPGNVRESGDA
jgi:hypothetical protein